ncbi:MAG: hypothetical protein R6U13_08925 [Desulfatiglandaceae bacterium]
MRKPTPGTAIRRHCVECVDSVAEVRNCGGDRMLGGQGDENGVCFFYPYRMGRGRPSVKTIRKFCLECMGGNRTLVAECKNRECTLNQYRMGRNPAYSRERAERPAYGAVLRQESLWVT